MPATDAVFVFIKISYKIFCNRFRVIRVKVPLPSVVEQSLRGKPNLKPSEGVRLSILEYVVDWDELEKTTDALLDSKKISNLKVKINKENNTAGHSSEAVAHLKRKSDEKDESFMYKMNDRHMNPDEPSMCSRQAR